MQLCGHTDCHSKAFLVPFSPGGDEQLGCEGKAAGRLWDFTRQSASARAVSSLPKPLHFRGINCSYPLAVCLWYMHSQCDRNVGIRDHSCIECSPLNQPEIRHSGKAFSSQLSLLSLWGLGAVIRVPLWDKASFSTSVAGDLVVRVWLSYIPTIPNLLPSCRHQEGGTMCSSYVRKPQTSLYLWVSPS